MKLFGVHPPNIGGADSERSPRTFSMAQLAVAGIAVTGVILLIVAFVVYDFNLRTTDRYFQERAKSLAGELAYGLVGLVQESIAKVEWVTLDPQVVEALVSKDPAQIAETEGRLAKQFPELVRVRLIPPGMVEAMEGGIFPKLGFADLEMLKAGEATGKPPPIEAHFFGMETAHVDIVRPVRNKDGAVVGQLLVSYGGDFVQSVLDKVVTPFGFVQIRQVGSGQHTGVVLAQRGAADLMGSGAGYSVPVVGTRWEVSYWPAPAEYAKLTWRAAILWAVFAVAFLLLGLITYVLYRTLNKAFQTDYETLLDVVRGIASGQPRRSGHHFRLRDFQKKLEILTLW